MALSAGAKKGYDTVLQQTYEQWFFYNFAFMGPGTR